MTTDAMRQDLELEYQRLKERADRLDTLIRTDGREWVEFLDKRSGTGDVVVIIDRLLAEARQTAIAMTAIARALANSLAEEKDAAEEAASKAADPSDEVRRKREEKQRQVAGPA